MSPATYEILAAMCIFGGAVLGAFFTYRANRAKDAASATARATADADANRRAAIAEANADQRAQRAEEAGRQVVSKVVDVLVANGTLREAQARLDESLRAPAAKPTQPEPARSLNDDANIRKEIEETLASRSKELAAKYRERAADADGERGANEKARAMDSACRPAIEHLISSITNVLKEAQTTPIGPSDIEITPLPERLVITFRELSTSATAAESIPIRAPLKSGALFELRVAWGWVPSPKGLISKGPAPEGDPRPPQPVLCLGLPDKTWAFIRVVPTGKGNYSWEADAGKPVPELKADIEYISATKSGQTAIAAATLRLLAAAEIHAAK